MDHDNHDEQAPADLIPRRTPTAEDAAQVAALAGREITIVEPGEILLDLDGIPIAAAEPTEHRAVISDPVLDLDADWTPIAFWKTDTNERQ